MPYNFKLFCCLIAGMLVFDSCKEDDEELLGPATPSDFFTLTVDPSFITSSADHWIMASTTGGKWIDAQAFEGGETIILNGVAEDDFFTLHFLVVSKPAQGDFVTIKSFGEVPVNGTWLLKTPEASVSGGELALQVTNYFSQRPFPNSSMEVSSNVGILRGGGSGVNGTFNLSYELVSSPADVLVTLYKDGVPHYADFIDVTLPSAITVDASTDLEIADRIFTMNLPANDYHFVSIEALPSTGRSRYSMSNFTDLDGGSSVNLGYKDGYPQYATRVSYTNGNVAVNYSNFASTVEENPTFQPFNLSVTKPSANDFACTSDLTFDVSVIDFHVVETGFVMLWKVVQPKPAASSAIDFKVNGFPPAIIDAYPIFPEVNEIDYSTVAGFQYMDERTYSGMIASQATRGNLVMDLSSENYYQFQLSAE